MDSKVNLSNTICVISAESVLSYERPALSKGYLLNDNLELPAFNTCAFDKQPHEME